MKKLVSALLVASFLTVSPGIVRAADNARDYEDSIMHPLRLGAYLLHPVGFALEWLVGRPFHYIISRPYLDRVFGYRPLGEEGEYKRYGERL